MSSDSRKSRISRSERGTESSPPAAGNKFARNEIAMIKVVAPTMACDVIDWAIQVHGGAGMCDDFPLAYAYTNARTLRFADGPDEVHRNAIAKWELGKYNPKPKTV